MKIPFASQSYKSQSVSVSAQRVVNMYAEKEPPDAKTDVALFGHPGILDFAVCGAGPIRGMHKMGGVAYVVSGNTLYSVSSTGVASCAAPCQTSCFVHASKMSTTTAPVA